MFLLRTSVLSAAILLAGSLGAVAGIEDSRFTFSSDGSTVDLELRGVSRRDVMERLFAGQTIKLEWLNREVADEAVSGNFSGPRADVVRQLLQQTNFILSYTTAGNVKQVSRVLVLGRASEGKAVVAASTSAISKQFQTASATRPPMPDPKAGGGMAPVATPSKGADLKPIPRPGGAAPAPPLPGANTANLAVPMPSNTGSAPMPMPMPGTGIRK